MCGINGFTASDPRRIQAMNAATLHRGPDGMAFHAAPGISLGHNRLNMTDLGPSAAQPLWSHNRRHAIVFNGEVYNHQELRRELAGYPFTGMSDTETVLAAYERWGVNALPKLHGMFAFAVWSPDRQELFLARDASGVKPLYYEIVHGELRFSSEIKGLLAHHGRRAISLPAFSFYLRCGYVPAPLTMFSGVAKFPAGHYAVFSRGVFRIDRYASHSLPGVPYESRAMALEAIRSSLQSSVSRHLASERPLGMYLSGGIDSGAILDCASRSSDSPLRTFSVSYALQDDESPEKFNADAALARRVAAAYGTHHEETVVSPDDVPSLLSRAAFHLDEPIANPTVISMMALARDASRSVRAVLSGDGGDELFGGYPRYPLSRRISALRFLPRFMRPPPLRDIDSPLDRFGLFMWEKDARILPFVPARFLSPDHRAFFGNLFDASQLADFTSSFMDIDRRTWLVDESLMSADKMTMASGLEARVPFLDPAVIAVSDRLPVPSKASFFSTKILLREAFRGRLPDYILDQPKRGWMSPGAKWLRRPAVHAWAKEMCSASTCAATAPFFDWGAVHRAFDRHAERKEYHLPMLWKALAFQAWASAFRGHIS